MFHVVVRRTVELFLEDRVLFVSLELRLEVTQGLCAAVGATTLVCKVIAIVLRLFSGNAPAWVLVLVRTRERRRLPVALPTALLLYALGIGIDVPRLGEVTRETFFSSGGTISDGAVVSVVGLVASSHCLCGNVSMSFK